jgi:hypothetical protein
MCSCVGWQLNRLMKIMPDEVQKQTVVPPAQDLVQKLFDDFVLEVTIEGRKTSEGDGRTAADIEREMELAAQENRDGAE